MAGVAAEAGSSIGSLYFRFGDKSQLVSAALTLALDDFRRRAHALIETAERRKWPAKKLIEAWVSMLVDLLRERRSLVREMARHAAAQPTPWNPIRDTRIELENTLIEALKRGLQGQRDASWEARFRIGMQMVAAFLTQMLLIDPGPLRLDDRGVKSALFELFSAYVAVPKGAPRRR